MATVGSIRIGTELDTKNFDKEILALERKVRELEDILSKKKQLGLSSAEIQDVEVELEKTKNRLVDLYDKREKLNQPGGLKNFKESAEGLGDSFKSALVGAGKLVLAVFGLRTAYMALRKASSYLATYDKQYATDLEYIKYVLTQMIAPVLRAIVKITTQLLGYVNSLINSMFGINLFAKGSAKSFQKMKSSASGVSKAVKEIKKQLAGFDEMNVLTEDKGDSDTGAGAILPSMDLSQTNFQLNFDKIKDGWRKLVDTMENTDWRKMGRNLYENIKKWLTNIDWGGIASSIFEGIGALFGTIGGFIFGFLGGLWDDIRNYFKYFIEDAEKGGGDVALGILLGIIHFFENIGVWIDKNIFQPFINGFKKAFGIASPAKSMIEMGEYIIQGLYEGLKGIWDSVKAIIDTLVTNIKSALTSLATWFKNNIIIPVGNTISNLWDKTLEGARNVWEGIKSIFSKLGNFLKETFSNAWSAVKNIFSKGGSIFTAITDGISSTFKKLVNGIIDGINSVVAVPFKAINSALQKLKKVEILDFKPFDWITTIEIPKIPKLAVGGIINVPNRGRMIGGALAGESGAEGVIPLTDQQAMETLGEAIGRYITINANIVNKMNGRILSREMQQIKNDQDFAYNS